MKTTFTIIVSLVGLLAGGCSQKSIDADDLRAQIEQAQKLARECVTFLYLQEQRHLTHSFYKSHSDYLNKKAEELQKETGSAHAKPEISSLFTEYRMQLDELSRQTAKLDSSPDKQQLQQLDQNFGELERKF